MLALSADEAHLHAGPTTTATIASPTGQRRQADPTSPRSAHGPPVNARPGGPGAAVTVARTARHDILVATNRRHADYASSAAGQARKPYASTGAYTTARGNYNGRDSFTFRPATAAEQQYYCPVTITVNAVNRRAGGGRRHADHAEDTPASGTCRPATSTAQPDLIAGGRPAHAR